MKKRSIKIGNYDTATYGWTLTGCILSDPEQKVNYVERPGGDGSWDLSTALTGGVPRYKNRSLTVTLECSEGAREDREMLINEMVNQLDGLEWPIVLPDRPDYYLQGRVHVAVTLSSPAYAAVTVTATCEPWLYAAKETIKELTASDAEQTVLLTNYGRRTVVPRLTVAGGTATIALPGAYITLEPGSYEWPTLQLAPGLTEVVCAVSGLLTFTYREAVLR